MPRLNQGFYIFMFIWAFEEVLTFNIIWYLDLYFDLHDQWSSSYESGRNKNAAKEFDCLSLLNNVKFCYVYILTIFPSSTYVYDMV